MRKILVVTLGLVTLGASVQLAIARQASCSQLNAACWKGAWNTSTGLEHCDPLYERCMKDGSWGNVGGPGSFRKEFKADTLSPEKNATAKGAAQSVVRDHRHPVTNTPAAGGSAPVARAGTSNERPSAADASSPVVRDHRHK
jgi:hypothetical protein